MGNTSQSLATPHLLAEQGPYTDGTKHWINRQTTFIRFIYYRSRTNLGFSRFSLLLCFKRCCWSGNNLIYDTQSFSAGLQRSAKTCLSCQGCSQALICKCDRRKWRTSWESLITKTGVCWSLTTGTDLEQSAVCSGEIWWLEWSVCHSPDPGKSWCPCLYVSFEKRWQATELKRNFFYSNNSNVIHDL